MGYSPGSIIARDARSEQRSAAVGNLILMISLSVRTPSAPR
jgi:hypothetical protein